MTTIKSLKPHPKGGWWVPTNAVIPFPGQPRKHFGKFELDRLADSIASAGQKNPIQVIRRGDEFALVDGERRWRACKQGNIGLIWAVISNEMTDPDLFEESLVLNQCRQELTPLELARGMQQLVEKKGLSREEVARHLGVSLFTVSSYLRVLDLHPDVLALMDPSIPEEERFPVVLAMLLVRRINDPSDQIEVARAIKSKGLRGLQAKRLIESKARELGSEAKARQLLPSRRRELVLNFLGRLRRDITVAVATGEDEYRRAFADRPADLGSVISALREEVDSLTGLLKVLTSLQGGEPASRQKPATANSTSASYDEALRVLDEVFATQNGSITVRLGREFLRKRLGTHARFRVQAAFATCRDLWGAKPSREDPAHGLVTKITRIKEASGVQTFRDLLRFVMHGAEEVAVDLDHLVEQD